jgi:hypothetical protein
MEEQESVYEYTRNGKVYVTPSLELAHKRATAGHIYIVEYDDHQEVS